MLCVCVDPKCFAFFLLRDVFKSLNYRLDLWLSSLLDCIHFCVFLLFEKLFLSSSIASRQISIYWDPWTVFSRQILSHLNPLKLSRICLDSFSIDSRSIEKVSVFLIAIRSIEVLLPSTDSRQYLDRFIYWELVLDKSSIHQDMFSIYRSNTISDFIFFDLSQQKTFLFSPKHSLFSQNLKPTWISA